MHCAQFVRRETLTGLLACRPQYGCRLQIGTSELLNAVPAETCILFAAFCFVVGWYWQHEGAILVVQIHTGKMEANSFLGKDVDLWDLAQRCKNFSGAEIEGLVKSATSFALNRQVDFTDLSKPIDDENLKV